MPKHFIAEKFYSKEVGLIILNWLPPIASIKFERYSKMKENSPLVSIGLPVYNGENYIREAIEAILNQSYQNLELIISDNASNDSTEAICRGYKDLDSRVRYHRFDKNYGATKNFNKTFELASGKYFKWASHDDTLDKDYIKVCIESLEGNSEIVLCQSYKVIIDDLGREQEKLEYDQIHFLSSKFVNYLEFLKRFKYHQDDADIVLGVFRTKALKRTDRIKNFHSSDLVLLAQTIFQGKVTIVDHYYYFRRFHKNMSTNTHVTSRERAKWFDTSKKRSTRLPMFIWYVEFLKCIQHSEFSSVEKFKCYFSTSRWLYYRIVKFVRWRLKKLGISTKIAMFLYIYITII